MKLLAYSSPARGHVYPLTALALEMQRRGHDISTHVLAADVGSLEDAGLAARAIDPRIEALQMDDYVESNPLKSVARAFGIWMDRAPIEVEELEAAIAADRPDLLLIDANSWGALIAAEASGLPWAAFCPWVLPIPSRDAPPMGPGLPPLGGLLGRLRDGIVGAVGNRAIDRAVLHRINTLRAGKGLAPHRTTWDLFSPPPLVLSLTAEGFDYPRSDWPANVRLVGPAMWAPPQPEPAWLDDLADPLVLVTCSTEYQTDRALLDTALAGLPGAGFAVLGTSAAHDPASFTVPHGSRVERFVSHEAVLQRAACVVCHGGLGITQKALASRVPVVVVPFGRDQSETARRVEVARAGVRLPAKRLDPQRLAAAVQQAITRQDGAARVSAAFAAAGGPPAAADALEQLLPVSCTT